MEQSGVSDKFGYGGDVEENEEPGQTESGQSTEVEARLEMISKSVKSIGLMTGVGMSYCIVLPSGDQITSNLLLPDTKTLKTQTEEIANNIRAIVCGFMRSAYLTGIDDETIENILSKIMSAAKKEFEDKKEEKNE